MKHQTLLIMIISILSAIVLLYANTPSVLAFGENGSGTSVDPYRISNIQQLQEVGNNLTAYYILVNNIDASDTVNWNDGAGFTPIGTTDAPFSGVFNGNGHTVTGLHINGLGYVGMFGYVGNGAVIKNVISVEMSVMATGYGNYVGGIVGHNKGTITNVYSSGIFSGEGGNYVGGVVGLNSGTISDSHSYVNITISGFGGYAGGLVGSNEDTISGSYSAGSLVSSGYNSVGGLVGINERYGSITSSYSIAEVVGNGGDYLGGFIGTNNGAITNSNSSGIVRGENICYIGGFVGFNTYNIFNSYSTGDAYGGSDSYVGGFVGNNGGYRSINTISSSYATGNVYGGSSSGSFVGINDGYYCAGNILNSYGRGTVYGDNISGGFAGSNSGYGSSITITNSFSTGFVSGDITGGFIGANLGNNITTVLGSFWDDETSGQISSAGGVGKTTANMKTKSTFTDDGWNFTEIWTMDQVHNNGYPFLLLRSGVPSAGGGLTVNDILAGQTVQFSFATEVTSITVRTAVDLQSMTVVLTSRGSATPTGVTAFESTENPYTYFSIDLSVVYQENTEEQENIGSFTIEFRVPSSWISGENVENIKLQRYTNNGWEPSLARSLGERFGYKLYDASVQGLSMFAITGSIKTETGPETPPEAQPEGERTIWVIAILLVVLILLIAIYLPKRLMKSSVKIQGKDLHSTDVETSPRYIYKGKQLNKECWGYNGNREQNKDWRVGRLPDTTPISVLFNPNI